jgi:hypothetical protein
MKPALILLATFLCLACCPAAIASNLDALLEPRADGTVDLQGYIQTRLEGGAKRVVVPPGRYRVAPQGRVHLRFHKLENVELVMKGVEMVCTETTQALAVLACRNFKLSGLTIDYDPLPFTQARITATGPKKEWMEFEIFKGYPENQLEERIAIFDAKTGELKVRVRYSDCQSFEKIGEHKYRVRRGPKYRYDPKAVSEEVGDILVTNNRFTPGGQLAHAVVCEDNTEVTIEDVALYSSNCFAFKERRCDRTTYLRCRLDRRAPEDDPVKREWKRLRSSNADAFNSSAASRGPQIIGCHAAYMDDDGVNIHGFSAMVVSTEGRTIRLISHPGRPDLRADDVLDLVSYDGGRLPAVVMIGKLEPDGKTTPEMAEFFSRQRMQSGMKALFSKPGVPIWKITVRDPVSLPIGSTVGASNRRGDGFAVKDSVFGPSRVRGILISASGGVISGNTCRDNWGSGIAVYPEWYWLNYGCSDDLVISGNTITGCHETSITIHALAGSGGPAPAGAHNRITVRDNTIITDRLPGFHVSSVKDGSIKGNTITSATAGEAISLHDNENVDVRDNTINQPKFEAKEQQ